jgi:hypothetical protein
MNNMTLIEVRPYRAHYFVSFKNTTIQRWAARLTKGDQYYVLTGAFWRAATDEKVMPSNAKKIAGGGNTMYFLTEAEATEVAARFVAGLVAKEVL